jgi:hypothetical protein
MNDHQSIPASSSSQVAIPELIAQMLYHLDLECDAAVKTLWRAREVSRQFCHEARRILYEEVEVWDCIERKDKRTHLFGNISKTEDPGKPSKLMHSIRRPSLSQFDKIVAQNESVGAFVKHMRIVLKRDDITDVIPGPALPRLLHSTVDLDTLSIRIITNHLNIHSCSFLTSVLHSTHRTFPMSWYFVSSSMAAAYFRRVSPEIRQLNVAHLDVAQLLVVASSVESSAKWVDHLSYLVTQTSSTVKRLSLGSLAYISDREFPFLLLCHSLEGVY